VLTSSDARKNIDDGRKRFLDDSMFENDSSGKKSCAVKIIRIRADNAASW